MIVKCHACGQNAGVGTEAGNTLARYEPHIGGNNNGEPFRCIQSGMLIPRGTAALKSVAEQIDGMVFEALSRTAGSYGGTGNKYHRVIHGLRMYHPEPASVTIDVYSVIAAFKVESPGLQHCAKKVLCGGLRDKGTFLQDLYEARDALARAIEDAERDDPSKAGKPCDTTDRGSAT